MPINSRAKGASGEREWAAYLREHLGVDARRGQQYCGANGDGDVITEDLPFHWEVKRVEKLQLDKAMSQAESDCPSNLVPIVAHRKNRQEWLVTMKASDWIELLRGAGLETRPKSLEGDPG